MWGWSLSPGTVPFRAGSSSRARDEPRLYLVPSRGGGGEEPLPKPPSRPCKAVKNSWKALGGGEGGQETLGQSRGWMGFIPGVQRGKGHRHGQGQVHQVPDGNWLFPLVFSAPRVVSSCWGFPTG